MNKFNSYRNIVFTLSTGLIFGAWEILGKFINCDNTFFVVIIGSISSYSFYKIVLKLVERCAIKFNFVKRFVFGRSYLDGIWVGAYIGTTNQPRYFVEYFEQDFNSLIIRSKCYYEDKKYKGEWKSTNASIDEDKGELYYTYETTMQDNGFKNIGFAIFTFDRKDKMSPPNKLFGFSSDIDSATMNRAVEEKVEKGTNLTDQELLEKAMEVYERNKYTILR